jgi:hypothetical protein
LLSELDELDELDDEAFELEPAAWVVTPVTCPATSAVSTPNAITDPAISAALSFFVNDSACALGMRPWRGGGGEG